MRKTLLVVLLPLFGCGVDTPPPAAPPVVVAHSDKGGSEPLVPGGGGVGGQDSPCAAADCNDDSSKDYIDPAPDGEQLDPLQPRTGKSRAQ